MVLKNTLFKKVYLLAGVIMAANMFVVNEMKAMEIENMDIIFNQDRSINTDENASPLKSLLSFVLTYGNYINFIGGLVFSGLNNYFKWWNYDAGGYRQFLWSWRSKRFLNDIFQFDVNFDLGRGAFWTILSFISIIFNVNAKTVAMYVVNKAKLNNLKGVAIAAYLFIPFLQGLISTPLTVHIAKFDFHISFSIDSLLWEFARKRCMNKIYRRANELVDESSIINTYEIKQNLLPPLKNQKNDNNRLEESDGN